jgi:hypothetical protein
MIRHCVENLTRIKHPIVEATRYIWVKQNKIQHMKSKLALSLAVALATLGGLEAQITPILPPNYGVTGIRQESGGNVLITGGTGAPNLNSATPAFLYSGPINSIPSSTNNATGLYTYMPNFGNGTISGGAQFYGPNTTYYNPAIGVGNIRAVGAYKLTANATYQKGMIYNGPLSGNGTWTSIEVPSDPFDPTGDTIPHSTMGSLVVGNFDLQSDVARGSGFIYDLGNPNSPWSTFDLGSYSTTFYGVWQNGGANSTKYTIVGGVSDVINGGKGLVFNYDSETLTVSALIELSFDNNPTLITHFEGISAVEGGFSLTSTTVQGAGYAFLPVNLDGSFGTPTWTAITNQIDPMAPTTGDTVIGTSVLGVYTTSGGVSSYIATVPEPSTYALFGLGAIACVAALRRRSA